MALGLTTTLRNTRLNAIATAIDAGGAAGTLKLYAGTRPATGGTATTLLGTLTFSYPCVATPAAAGVLEFDAITGDSSADNAGVASWARAATSGGTFVADFEVTVTGLGGDLTMDNTTVEAGATLTPGTITITDANP